MKNVKVEKANDVPYINIYPIADLHHGAKECNIRKFEKHIEDICADPYGYIVLLGDMFEISKNADEKRAEHLVSSVAEILEPVADRILCMVRGNHDRNVGTYNPIAELAEKLEIPQKYVSDDAILLWLTFGDSKNHGHRAITYSFYLTHGSGKARTEGRKIDALSSFGDNIPPADIIVCGHFHTPLSMRKSVIELDEANKGFYSRDRLFVETNAWLNYGGYAERAGMAPASIKPPIISLNGQGKKSFNCSL